MPATVVKLCEVWNRSYDKQANGLITATRIFLIQFDSDVTDMGEVLTLAQAESSFPALGDAYDLTSITSYGLGVTAQSYNVKEYDSQQNLVYLIEVSYSNSQIDISGPTSLPWTITFSSEKIEFAAYRTRWNTGVVTWDPEILPVAANKPVVNTAGDLFDPPVMAYRIRPIITLQKNFSQLSDIGTVTNIVDLMEYVGRVNSATVTVAGIYADYGQFLMDDINCVLTKENGEEYYNTTFRIIYDEEYFCEKILNAGFNQFVGGKLVKITLNGADPSTPQLLDANGALIVAATPALRQAAAVYRAFGTQLGKDFADLSLPTTF